MTTKVFLAALLALCVVGIKPSTKAKAEQTNDFAMPMPLDSSVHKAIDSVKIAKAKTEYLKSEIRDKVDELEDQQRDLVEIQRKIDSVEQRFAQR